MNYRFFPMTLGPLVLMNLSQSPYVSAGLGPSKINQSSFTAPEIQPNPDSRLENLSNFLFNRVLGYLNQNEIQQVALASKYCASGVSSFGKLELSLENQNLKEVDFLRYFRKNGIYKELSSWKFLKGKLFIVFSESI